MSHWNNFEKSIREGNYSWARDKDIIMCSWREFKRLLDVDEITNKKLEEENEKLRNKIEEINNILNSK